MGLAIFIVLMISFVFVPIVYNPTPKVPKIYSPIETDDLNAEEFELLELINKHRDKLGLLPLKAERLTSEICEGAVDNAIKLNAISHDGFTARAEATNTYFVSEICAKGYNSPYSTFISYLASPEHRRSIENPIYEWIGVSYKTKYNYCLLTKY